MYRKNFDNNRFQVQLETLLTYCKELDIIAVPTTAEVSKNFKVRNIKEVIKLAKLFFLPVNGEQRISVN